MPAEKPICPNCEKAATLAGELIAMIAPWWAVNVPESENDHTCTRCGHTVHLERGSEWLGPDDNYHWNLCNSCAQELVLEMWKKLDAVANIVTTDHETKESFISRVRSVLWANADVEARRK